MKARLIQFLAMTMCVLSTLFAAESAFRPAPNLPMTVLPMKAAGIHNLFSVDTNIFSGSAPEGEEGFAALARLGVKTIITVDGARPEVERARKHGIRYVHLPHGYDGINATVQAMLAHAARTNGPVYVHCHHGKHRGPTAVALICMANRDWSKEQAEAWLVSAGTSTNYIGLYNAVRQFRKPTPEQLSALPADLPEVAKVSGLVDAMVEVDHRWEDLKAIREAKYHPPTETHPDIVPAQTARILWEHYREAQRIPEVIAKGSDFLERLKIAEGDARKAERLLRAYAANPKADTIKGLDRAFDAMAESCVSCHKTYRDPAEIKLAR